MNGQTGLTRKQPKTRVYVDVHSWRGRYVFTCTRYGGVPYLHEKTYETAYEASEAGVQWAENMRYEAVIRANDPDGDGHKPEQLNPPYNG